MEAEEVVVLRIYDSEGDGKDGKGEGSGHSSFLP